MANHRTDAHKVRPYIGFSAGSRKAARRGLAVVCYFFGRFTTAAWNYNQRKPEWLWLSGGLEKVGNAEAGGGVVALPHLNCY
jgi:hypothetical protein